MNYYLLVAFLLGIIVGILIATYSQSKRLTSESVASCFKDVDWSVHTFSSNGVVLKTKDGCEHFYKTNTIDDAIESLNKLMSKA